MRYANLAFAIMLLTPLRAMAAPRPPVEVKLSHDRLVVGASAKVFVQTATDGYLLVMRTDTKGNIRILFPIDPSDNTEIRGGHKFEVLGRGDREAFTANENRGTGLVLAVRTDQPFTFTDFTTRGHWNTAAFGVDNTTNDPQGAMLDMVDRMTDGHYDYDVASYTVGGGAGWHGATYSGWYDPWYPGPYVPWAWSPYYYGPRIGFGITISPRFYRHGR